jgi:hypothetical protein
MRTFQVTLGIALLMVAVAGCSKPAPATSPAANAAAGHEHKAPHGGTAVALGQEAYHLELVRDSAAGTLTAYVLDGEMENFIRIKAPSFEITARVDGEQRPLVFKAAINPITGETLGDTAQFDAQADWLKTTTSFDATLINLQIRGNVFANVGFNFPRGNDRN